MHEWDDFVCEMDVTADWVAEATVGMLQQWDCEDCIKGMCFDTTASNTGKNNHQNNKNI